MLELLTSISVTVGAEGVLCNKEGRVKSAPVVTEDESGPSVSKLVKKH